MRWLLLLALLVAQPARAQLADWVDPAAGAPGFAIADARGAAQVVTAEGDHEVVRIAAADLRADIARVSGRSAGTNQIWAGTIGRSPAIDALVASGRLDAKRLNGAWESYIIATVNRPAPGVAQALVILGSDRRGTAYGIYELSRAIGVSPWHWWADVAPLPHPDLHVRPGTRKFGPPSVKYRGLFLNDEDWGLTPWSATNFEPGHGGMGPKTYARVFELLLRLRANTLWPAMHKISPAFNSDPENARLADRYAIVMGSSHSEPMLRNNVREWTAPEAAYDYGKNREGVRAYWEERARTNGLYENIYTLGMRGIHDSAMQGASDMPTRKAFLERIFTDQRDVIERFVSPDVMGVPQVFTPYKEVLDTFRAGLAVPDDVTLMWPDDNFGYIRRFPTPAERKRAGGAGVYYHLSYLGAPLSYLWLATTPPALIAEEMGRAFDFGADRMWIANVGDLKPGELQADYFLSLAWDVPGMRKLGVQGFVQRWAGENLDAGQAREIADVFAEHYRLNFERRPEHLQWWLTGERLRGSPWSIAQGDARLAAFDANVAAMRGILARIPAARRDAFFELLGYPVEAAAEANRRFLAAEAHDKIRDPDLAEALRRGATARAADARIVDLTRQYNAAAGGKWQGIMSVEPADGQWKSFRALPPVLPGEGAAPPPGEPLKKQLLGAPRPRADLKSATGNWRIVEGLGRDGHLLASRADPATRGSVAVDVPPGKWQLNVDLLPTYADRDGDPLRLTVRVDGKPFPVSVVRETGDKDWSNAVLDNRITATLPTSFAAGRHIIGIEAEGGGILIEALRFTPAADPIAPVPYYRDPVHDGAADPAIVPDPASGEWVMFYTNRRADLPLADDNDMSWVHLTAIGVARSADGAAWRYGGTAAIPQGCTGATLWAPEVQRFGNLWHMWITVVPGVFTSWNAPRFLVHLTSKDLQQWDCGERVDLGSDRIIDASVAALPTGGYRLWFNDERSAKSIRWADSADLKTWRIGGTAVDTPGEGPKAFRWHNRWWLISDAWRGLLVQHSDDAATWTRQPGYLLADPGTRPTDRAKGQHPEVIVAGNRAYIVYFVHQSGEPEAATDPRWNRRTVLQIAELRDSDAVLSVDRAAPVALRLGR